MDEDAIEQFLNNFYDCEVVNVKHETCDVLVDRTTKWGNPYVIGRDGDRDTCCDLYEPYYENNEELKNSIHELVGKQIGCHCKPKRCHGDFLAKKANEFYASRNISKTK